MPTYEYRCRDCGEHLEVVQAFTDEPLTICPACSGDLRKVFGNIGIVFKGSGFYKTDSRGGTTATKPGDSSAEKGATTGSSSSPAGDKAGDKSPAPASSGAATSSSSTGSGSSPAAPAAAAS